MNSDLELVRGGGDIFSDFGDANANTKRLKVRVAADIIGTLNQRSLSMDEAAELAHVSPAVIQRIRNADLSRLTLERLIRIAYRLGRQVELRMCAGRRRD